MQVWKYCEYSAKTLRDFKDSDWLFTTREKAVAHALSRGFDMQVSGGESCAIFANPNTPKRRAMISSRTVF